MSNVNINRGMADAFYRYKMPQMQSKVEGKGNGIKTVIPNMEEIAKSLSRPPSYPTKFFGCELGAQTTMDEKNSRYIVNGTHESSRLAELLDNFIKKFVLCASCGNPETDFVIKKNQDIFLSCKACGHVGKVDMTHKLIPFILKNPPDGGSKQAVKTKKERRAEKLQKQNAKTDAGDDDPEAEMAFTQALTTDAGNATPPAEPAAEEAPKELEPAEEFAQFVEEGNHTAQELLDQVENVLLNVEKAAAILVQVLFKDNIMKELPKQRKLLAEFVNEDKKKQKGCLGGLERLLTTKFTSELGKTPQLFKACYDADILDEDAFLDWSEKPSKKYADKENAALIREKAKPFIQWLKTAAEESSDEDE